MYKIISFGIELPRLLVYNVDTRYNLLVNYCDACKLSKVFSDVGTFGSKEYYSAGRE